MAEMIGHYFSEAKCASSGDVPSSDFRKGEAPRNFANPSLGNKAGRLSLTKTLELNHKLTK
jgi:hypothetical protein